MCYIQRCWVEPLVSGTPELRDMVALHRVHSSNDVVGLVYLGFTLTVIQSKWFFNGFVYCHLCCASLWFIDLSFVCSYHVWLVFVSCFCLTVHTYLCVLSSSYICCFSSFCLSSSSSIQSQPSPPESTLTGSKEKSCSRWLNASCIHAIIKPGLARWMELEDAKRGKGYLQYFRFPPAH